MGYGSGGNRGYGGNGSGRFEPKPGSGTLFVKGQKRNNQAPDYDGYFIADRDIRAGEKIKLVGWDKQSGGGNMITLRAGREQQEFPQNQGGYGGQPQNGYQRPQQGGNQPPQGQYPQGNRGGYSGQNALQGGYNPPQQGGYTPPPQNQGAYVPPGPNGNGAPPPSDEDDLPF